MKVSLLLAALLLTPSAANTALAADSRVIATLIMNVDSDGVEDQLRVVETARANNPRITDRNFEIVFGKTKKVVKFPGLLEAVTYKPKNKESDGPCHSGVMDGENELTPGTDRFVNIKRVGENSFAVSEEHPDNGCASYDAHEFQASLNEAGYTLDRAHRLSGQVGMGSGWMNDGDFDFQSMHGKETLIDRSSDEEGANGSNEWTIPSTCKPLLTDIRKQKIPACAEYKKN